MALAASTRARSLVVIFQILYSSSYTILLLLLLLLLAVTPGDHIYQTLSNDNWGNVSVVAGTYFLTACIAIFIYASRLYTNRTTLAAIPKSYLPIEPGEVGDKIRKMILKNRRRCALIAWDSRPRDLRPEMRKLELELSKETELTTRRTQSRRKTQQKMDVVIPVDPRSPPWGEVIHPGWSAPDCEDLPDLQFEVVVAELPNLIEARAVSVAPPDPYYTVMAHFEADAAPPDPRVVPLLQRPPRMGFRDYLQRLENMGVINSAAPINGFLNQYEHARFSTRVLLETEFRELIASFTAIITTMGSVDPQVMAEIEGEEDGSFIAEGSDNASVSSVLVQKGASRILQNESYASSTQSFGSVIHHDLSMNEKGG